MKIFANLKPTLGYAFIRINKALHDYAPEWVQWVNTEEEADHVFMHVTGDDNIPQLKRVKLPIMFQHVCVTNYGPDNIDTFWEKALIVISYNDLRKQSNKDFNFYRTPWGYEEKQFNRFNFGERYNTVFQTGHIAKSECIDKTFEACKKLGMSFVHTGENFHWEYPYKYIPYLDDTSYNWLLNNVKYVVGLRESEGFEMACLEGAKCGARPIVPSLPSYDWYKDFGYYIDMSQNITDQLVEYFRNTPIEYTQDQVDLIDTFKWSNLIPKIYEEIKKYD